MVNVIAEWKVKMYVSQTPLGVGVGRLKVLFHDAPRCDHEEDCYATAQDTLARWPTWDHKR